MHPHAIVIPTYGRTSSLARLLRALEGQQRSPETVVVVDQNPAGVLDRLLSASRLPIDHVRLAQPNCAAARNVGFLRTRAPIVVFLDDDLEPDSRFSARFLAYAESAPDVAAWSAIPDGDVVSADELERRLARLRRTHHPQHRSLVRAHVAHGRSAALAFRREAFAATGGFDAGLFEFARAGEDHELFARMILRGMRLWFALDVRVRHHDREPGGAEMRTVGEARQRERMLRLWAYKACAHGGGAPDARQLAYLARMIVVNRRALSRNPFRTALDVRAVARHVRAAREMLKRAPYPTVSPRTVDHIHRVRARDT